MAVKANRVSSFMELQRPGDFMFEDDAASGISFVCPCGCSALLAVNFRRGINRGPVWDWDGNRDQPTVTPSIRHLDGCGWHGYLTKGEFRDA